MTREELLEMPEEAYMNGAQRAYFRGLLLRMRDEILKELNSAREHLRAASVARGPPRSSGNVRDAHAPVQ